MESLSYDSSVTSPGSGSGTHSQRTKRMRTSFKHHQLRTMKSYFAINQNPDAKDLKQLAQKTGLSKRVLQVWFQNARAKWRRNIMRQEGSGGTPSSGTPVPGQTAPPSPNSHVALLQQDSSNGSLSSAHQVPLHSRSPDLHSHHSLHQQLNFNDIY